MAKITTQTIRKLKGKQPIVAVTAYDFITARLASEAGVDLMLVGDSVGTTMLGFETTVPVTMEMMMHHAKAVVRANPKALVVIDIPFSDAHCSWDHLLKTSAHCLQETGVDAVKIEGGVNMAEKISRLSDAGIPVVGHIGLLPQQVLKLGGYKRFGKNEKEKQLLLADAKALEEAGAFCIVGEMIDHDCAREISESISVPLIGIGAGPDCDGQILVSTDLIGMNPQKVPSFVKMFGDVKGEMTKAFSSYAKEVRSKKFP